LTAELLLPLAGTNVYAATSKDQRTDTVIALIRRMNQDLHEATCGRHARFFKEILDKEGKQMVPREKLPDVAKTALSDGSLFYNPEELDYNDFFMVLEAAWEGKPLDTSLIQKG
jgi:alcohol dehydrogenase